jgi:hypothetical protein
MRPFGFTEAVPPNSGILRIRERIQRWVGTMEDQTMQSAGHTAITDLALPSANADSTRPFSSEVAP